MNTILMITLLLVIVAPAVVFVYRADRLTSHLTRVPFGFGPDSERIHDELVVLNLRRRDCA
ncbi:hypothetical protein [Gordonia hankookensis]|uniref:Uncharacterized protein n=1 Tax=Gordonia hankookensis TaxID=589403 RepID=A0ABR7WDB3_9ACTN|nr:hypothetical protein [Gordonia hankookensis]MBD1320786.1 hypothetical protein [Gordonia hankookensis]NDZ92638.1 hypothetical protein [Streptomyces sp. SID11726]NEB26792.1 hypothetical protein [Streptomyces sp. SID6673]